MTTGTPSYQTVFTPRFHHLQKRLTFANRFDFLVGNRHYLMVYTASLLFFAAKIGGALNWRLVWNLFTCWIRRRWLDSNGCLRNQGRTVARHLAKAIPWLATKRAWSTFKRAPSQCKASQSTENQAKEMKSILALIIASVVCVSVIQTAPHSRSVNTIMQLHILLTDLVNNVPNHIASQINWLTKCLYCHFCL